MKKKIAALLVAVVVLFSLAVPVWATSENPSFYADNDGGNTGTATATPAPTTTPTATPVITPSPTPTEPTATPTPSPTVTPAPDYGVDSDDLDGADGAITDAQNMLNSIYDTLPELSGGVLGFMGATVQLLPDWFVAAVCLSLILSAFIIFLRFLWQ